MNLFHVSENPRITRFDPRPSPYTDEPAVWAVDEAHLYNYLLPRDCPRVRFTKLHPKRCNAISWHQLGSRCRRAELATRHVEIRILPELWTLRDAILASTLQFSFIRMKNAEPRKLEENPQ